MTQISVILPVYNAELYIEEAVNSILVQTFKDFELIIINDGSTDGSFEILSKLAMLDSRVRLISRENKGLIATLNEAISLAKSKYIARMDADDIALNTRLAKQFEFLQANPKVAVLGTCYRYIDVHGEIGSKRNTFTSHEDITASFYFCNPIAHPSVMINYSLLGSDFCYLEQYKTIEDLELWSRLSVKYRLANLPDVLLHYRVLNSSVSGKNLKLQRLSAAQMLSQSAGIKSLDIFKVTYNYSVNSASYLEFIRACIKLNLFNFKKRKVSRFALFKRSFIAILLWFRGNVRGEEN
ncbi:MAG: glycosyltransferase family 2 protein [Colwellia sp.]|nr:glycosyltransferase family 2 protein [Colwellia sp.]